MYEATFCIEGDGIYAALTAETDASVELWCNDHCDLLHIENDTTEEILTDIRERVGVQDLVRKSEEVVVITDDCLRQHDEDLIDVYLARHNCLLLPPLRYDHGAKSCRVLALDSSNLTACYRDLVSSEFPVSVERKREIETVGHDTPLLTLDSLLPTFSPRQREAFITAYDAGYYEIPRKTTTREIADSLDIERRTAEEHIRRAENKLIEALIEYVS